LRIGDGAARPGSRGSGSRSRPQNIWNRRRLIDARLDGNFFQLWHGLRGAARGRGAERDRPDISDEIASKLRSGSLCAVVAH
jgi:hypothetical protein